MNSSPNSPAADAFRLTDLERQLLEALIGLEAAAKAGAGVPPVLSRLDDLTGRLPKTTAPELLHYLHRKSYEKARLWLEGRDSQNAPGTCRSPGSADSH